MKFTDVKTLEHLLKEYGGSAVGGGGHGANAKANKITKTTSIASGPDVSKGSPTVNGTPQKDNEPKEPMVQPVQAKDLTVDPKNKNPMMVSMQGKKEPLEVLSPVDDGENPEALVVKDKKGKVFAIAKDQEVIEIPEGKLSKIAKRKGKKLKIKDLKGKIKKLSKKRLKEADPKLFEINFNRKTLAKEAFDAPVKCGFEAETFFFSVEDNGGREQVDDMSIGDIEYHYGDLPDQAYEDYQDWLYEKGTEEYLDDLIDDKVQEYKEDEDYLNDFIDSGGGPSSEAVERYKNNFEEEDPKEYENREEDGWEYINWVREFVEEEYEEEYLAWLRNQVAEENDLRDEAKELAEGDYSMDEWINDNYSYMSSFLDDYGYEYSRAGGDVEGVADELMTWIKDNSEFQNYPESGDYGETNTSTGWAVENDSSIEADEGAAAELISPVFNSPRDMLTEMKSLFDWSEKNFGTNRSTGLHVTMSWHGEAAGQQSNAEPNKLKMALLLGDEYLLAEFGRLKNSYAKSQYQNVLKYAEGMKRGDAKSFEQFEKALSKSITSDKFQSIHFKTEKDRNAGTDLIEFRIAGGSDYNTMYEKVVKAVVRYATVMKAGYDENAYRKDYVNAVGRLLRKAKEIDPKKLNALNVVNHPIIDSAKNIIGKKDYFEMIKLLSASVEFFQEYEAMSDPSADKEWKQSIKDYQKKTGDTVEIKEEETVYGDLNVKPSPIAPSRLAVDRLQKAQRRFASAVTLLARDIADGTARSTPNAKTIAEFRKYTAQLKIDGKKLQELTLKSMDDLNFNGTDKENVVRLQKGVTVLFKKDIIKTPEYLTPQQIDSILKGAWQFTMSDDMKDNIVRDKFTELLQNVSPSLEKNEIAEILKGLSKTRQENDFVRRMKSGGYGEKGLLGKGKVTTKNAVSDLLKFLEPYKGYSHPTSPRHHRNINSDDNYEDVAQMRLIQRMRDRLDHLKDLETDDKEKYNQIVKQLAGIGDEFLKGIKPIDFDKEYGYLGKNGLGPDGDGREFLGHGGRFSSDYEQLLNNWKEDLGKIARMSKEDDDLYNFSSAYDDIVFSSINLSDYYRAKAEKQYAYKSPQIKSLIKTRFTVYKKFLLAFDKIFQNEGFADLKNEIKNKNQLDKRNKDFEKNVRDGETATLNIPSHSFAYIESDLYKTMSKFTYTDDEMQTFMKNNRHHFEDDVNTGMKVFVVDCSHWSDAEDATEGLELIRTFEKNKNYYHSWRKKGYNRILTKFKNVYKLTFDELVNSENFSIEYQKIDIVHMQKFKEFGIAITHKGDSRKGAAGINDLLSDELTKNPSSGEPLNRSSSMSWSMNNDQSDQKQFDAFDWNIYPERMKGIVAKVMKQDRYGSFKVALDVVLKKVLDGDVKLDIDNSKIPHRDQDDSSYENSYDKARSMFGMFDVMMQNGMQKYLARGEVNNLVAFLNNDDNPYDFKQKVLTTFKKAYVYGDEPFNSFQDALAASRRSNESVFTKFDKLTLEEQLRIVEKSTVLEKLTKKSEGPSSEALPDNSIPHLLNKLLSQPMPAGDLKKQMDAYWALPVPQMLSDFREVRGTGGDRADLRHVLKRYINSQLDPSIRKQVKLVENKDDVIDKIKDLPDDDAQTDKIVSYIEQLLNDMGVGGRLASLTNQLDQIDDKEVKRDQLKIAKIIASIDMTPLERAQLFAMWKKDNLLDSEKLLTGGRYVFSDVFKGYGTEAYMTDFVDDLSNVVNYGIGAGEFLLTVLSNKVTGIGSGKGKGDLIIDKKHVELKTKTEKNARFKDWNVQPDQTWASKVEGFKRDFADIDEVANSKSTGMNSSNLIQMLQNPALQSDLPRKKQALRSIMGIFQATNPTLSVAQITELSKLLLAGNDVNFKQVYGRYNILNYLNVKRSDGDLDGILFMNKQTKTLHYVRDLEEMKEITLDVGTIYPVSTNAIYPYPQIGVK